MSGKYLLDTNIVLGFLKGVPDIVEFVSSVAPDSLYVSVISRMELLSFHGMSSDEERLIRDFLAHISVIPLDADVEAAAIRLRRETRRKMPDAIVAASAVVLQSMLVTCDHDLAATAFPGLETHNPSKCCLCTPSLKRVPFKTGDF